MSTRPENSVAPSLTLKRRLAAPPALVFDAWTLPRHLANWFGPREARLATIRADMDVRAGGRFRISFSSEDGEFHEVGGVYREVVANERLVFTWAWHTTPERESLVSVIIEPDGEGTMLTLTHERFFDEAARDGHRYGWGGALDKLEAYLAGGAQQ